MARFLPWTAGREGLEETALRRQGRQVSVFGAALWPAGTPEYAEARWPSRRLAEAGYRVCTGDYGGGMDAVSQRARQAGGEVGGVTPAGDPRLSPEQRSRDLHGRLVHLPSNDAWIGLHGGGGTLHEVALAWVLLPQMSRRRKPLIRVGASRQWAIAGLARTLRAGPDDLALLTFVPTVDAARAAQHAAG